MIGTFIIKKAKDGDDDAFNEILKEFSNLILLKARKYFIVGGDQNDLFQEGVIGLFKAVKSFKENKDCSFKSFALLCIKRQILTAVSANNAYKNKYLNQAISDIYITDEEDFQYSEYPSLNYYNPEEIFLLKEKLFFINKIAKSTLSPMEILVLKKIEEGFSYREIAEFLNISDKSADNCVQRIKRKIRIKLERYFKS
ncbi:MAG: sigma-70 family RNA polymerase sigma factor [Cetobacterium sp.]|uniref:sigma-70 family RNA polymerase sigma factor n=1 Tax=Cetobacterium sp. TaxID=2071632 RepID=UPI003F2A65D2